MLLSVVPGVFSYCSPSKKIPELLDDLNRRQCLRQCEIDSTSGMIRPTFEDWEEFCYETSLTETWDGACLDFYCCLYGCEVFGGDRSICSNAVMSERPVLLNQVRLVNNEKEVRCDIQQCRSWCARTVFDTCR